jgi:transposase
MQAMYVKFEAAIEKLNQRVEEQACERSGAQLLMTYPGVEPVTALATEVFLGDPTRFPDGKALASHLGIISSEYSSGGAPAARRAEQTRQPSVAVSLVCGGGTRRTPGSGVAAFLPPQIDPERSGEGESGRHSGTIVKVFVR